MEDINRHIKIAVLICTAISIVVFIFILISYLKGNANTADIVYSASFSCLMAIILTGMMKKGKRKK